MPKKSLIIVRGQFEFCHRYATAPAEVAYLRNLHRHMFNYEVELEVFHDDRELEFIMVKHDIDGYLARRNEDWEEKTSCEQMAKCIGLYLQTKYGFERSLSVSIFEDNENGAKVIMM